MANQEMNVEHRILLSARAEFAEHGLAGARVDRIAKGANSSKERLYAHFADKVALFQAVLNLNGMEFFEAVSLSPADIPDFVGRVFDHSLSHPEHLRMMTWARLEGFNFDLHSAVMESERAKSDSIREAQAAGLVDASWKPDELIPLLFGIGLAWTQAPGTTGSAEAPAVIAAHRAAAVEASRRLIQSR
ncbi:TetR family transcriptional regulator [Glaciihabitans sp. dw_435]|uniref:TetR family transcriptional regulator n=1 Tax=Glaciihabitans sp. dw_435 TaxID=2720081 RepID=UPI001BD23B8E|nr:TetR family transcriptional regulator [Glaciihabitans sp. dw_435]